MQLRPFTGRGRKWRICRPIGSSDSGDVITVVGRKSGRSRQLIALEAAKPIRTAKAEVARTIATYKFAAEEAKRIHGETIPLDAASGGEGRVAYTTREPIGVIGAITPFNFPISP